MAAKIRHFYELYEPNKLYKLGELDERIVVNLPLF